MTELRNLMRVVWRYLREVSGESDYARYCIRARRLGLERMTPEAFYLSQLRRKYSRPSRCY